MKEDTKHLIATFFKIINIVTFAIVSIIWKLKLDKVSSEQQYLLQAFAATVTVFLIMVLCPGKGPERSFTKIKKKFKVHSIKTYVYRAIINVIGVLLWMKALKLIGANEAMAITYLAPPITSSLAVIFLKEKIKLSWVVALLLGLCGVAVMILGGSVKTSVVFSSVYFKGIILAFIATTAFSVYNIICKVQTNVNDDYFAQAFYKFLFATLLAIPLSIGKLQVISVEETIWALFSGVIGVLSVVALFLSYKFSSVVKMSPHSYLKIIVTAVTLYFLKDEIPSQNLMIAIAFILVGNFCIIFEGAFYRTFGGKRKNSYQESQI